MSIGEGVIILVITLIAIILFIMIVLEKINRTKDRNKHINICGSCGYELGIFEALELRCPSCKCDI